MNYSVLKYNSFNEGNMKAHFIILPVIAFFLTANVGAQDSIVDQNIKVNQQLWLDYNFKNIIIDSLRTLNTQVGFRKIFPNVFNRFLVISTVEIPHEKSLGFLKLEKPIIKSFHLGAGLIYTQNYDAKDNLEFRLIQGFKFDIQTIKLITLTNYIRFEERFQNDFNESGWTAGYRIRYRISTELAWNKHLLDFNKGIYIPLNTEFFFNFKKADRFNDLIRIAPGLGYKLKNDWKLELYLIFNETKNSTETNNSSSDFILRLRVFNDKVKK